MYLIIKILKKITRQLSYITIVDSIIKMLKSQTIVINKAIKFILLK